MTEAMDSLVRSQCRGMHLLSSGRSPQTKFLPGRLGCLALKVLLLVLSACVSEGASQGAATAQCRSDVDCSLNGECDVATGACACDKGWRGPTCGELNLEAAPSVAYGMGAPTSPNTSSWGGGPPVLDNSTGEWHLYVSEIAGHCGMCTWGRMCQIAHATARQPVGPYTRAGLAVPTQSHNAYYVYSPLDKMHLIYHIFEGNNPESCNPFFACTNGSTPGCSGLRPPTPWPKPTCPINHGVTVHYSKSLDGPWVSSGPLDIRVPHNVSTAGDSNPAPYIFPNGTVIMLGRGKDAGVSRADRRVINHNVFLYRAASWNSTYEWVPSDGIDGAVNIGNGKVLTEDPVLYRGRRGFHVLLHSHPGLTHAWSEDGLTWQWSGDVMGPVRPPPLGDYERPRVLLDADGDLGLVFVSTEIGPGDASHTAVFRARSG